MSDVPPIVSIGELLGKEKFSIKGSYGLYVQYIVLFMINLGRLRLRPICYNYIICHFICEGTSGGGTYLKAMLQKST